MSLVRFVVELLFSTVSSTYTDARATVAQLVRARDS